MILGILFSGAIFFYIGAYAANRQWREIGKKHGKMFSNCEMYSVKLLQGMED